MASTREQNAALVTEFLTSVVASGDTDALDIFLRGDAVDRRRVHAHRIGRDTVAPGYWRALAAADVDLRIDDVVAADGTVAVRGTLAHRHRELPLERLPGRDRCEIHVAWFCRVEGGRIVETWTLPDERWLVAQLGAPAGGT